MERHRKQRYSGFARQFDLDAGGAVEVEPDRPLMTLGEAYASRRGAPVDHTQGWSPGSQGRAADGSELFISGAVGWVLGVSQVIGQHAPLPDAG